MEGNIKTMCDILGSQKALNENIKIKKNKKDVESLWSYSQQHSINKFLTKQEAQEDSQ